MKRIWNEIVNAGIQPGMKHQFSKKIRITNQVAASISCLAFLYIFVFYWVGFTREALEVLFVVGALFVPVLLNHFKLYIPARLWFVAAIDIAINVYAGYFGKDSGIQSVLFQCACIPWLFFDLRNMKYIVGCMLFTMAVYFIYDSTPGMASVPISAASQQFIYVNVAVGKFIILGLFMYFFASQNNKSEKILFDTYKQFFEDIPSPMWILDEETLQFLAINEFAIQKYGYSREEFLSMRVLDIRPEDNKGAVVNFIKDKFSTNTTDAGYVRHRKKNGDIFYVHILSNSTVFNGRRARVALAVDVNDKVLTELKNEELNRTLTKANDELQQSKENLEQQEEELRQINEELTQQAEELRVSEEELKTQEEELRQVNMEMAEKNKIVETARQALAIKAEELEIASKYKSEFLANMSHELRTPLNSVLILANLLHENKTKNLTDKQIEYARIIHKSGSDLLKLINDILDLSKIEAGKVELQSEPFRIKEVVHDMEQLFTVLANEKKIDFATEIKGGVPEQIITDRQRVEQVIKNLLSNAFKFTPAAGTITLAFGMEQERLAISVADTGIGIPPDKQQLIFEAFRQADGSTNRKFGGTGLGLSISKELVKRLQGEIRLSSIAGEGSTFTILLPRVLDITAATARNDQKDDSAPQVYASHPAIKEQTKIADDKGDVKPGEQVILVVEDDAVFADHVKDFANSKGYKTIVAMSGDEGIHYAKKYKPAAIILDLGLPVIDGRNVLKIIKSDEELKHIPVHVITSEDRVDVPTANIESYLQKPVGSKDLEEAFSNISTYIREHNRNILILSTHDENIRQMFSTLTTEQNAGVNYDTVETVTEAIKMLQQKTFDCIIADIGNNIQKGIQSLEELKSAAKGTYIITCLEGDISSADEKQLKKHTESIIRKSTNATNRLMDEVALFLHKVKHATPVPVPENVPEEFDKSLSGKKVLLADDDMRNVFALTALLEEQGMEVLTAEHGKEALELLDQNDDVDIVLMDIMMPEMDGYEAMRHIREGSKYRSVPILALTARAMTGDREKCIEAGASDYITKPIDNNKLFSLMRVWLSH